MHFYKLWNNEIHAEKQSIIYIHFVGISDFKFLYLLTTPGHRITFSNTVLSLKLDEEPNAPIPVPCSVDDKASTKEKYKKINKNCCDFSASFLQYSLRIKTTFLL